MLLGGDRLDGFQRRALDVGLRTLEPVESDLEPLAEPELLDRPQHQHEVVGVGLDLFFQNRNGTAVSRLGQRLDRAFPHLPVIAQREFLDSSEILVADQVHDQRLRGVAYELLFVTGQFARHIGYIFIGKLLYAGNRLLLRPVILEHQAA